MAENKRKKGFALTPSVTEGGGTGGIVDPETGEMVISGLITDTTVGQIPSATDPTSASKSVIGEVIEAFFEISTGLNSLGNAFTSFGNTVQSQSLVLGDQMKSSVNNIKLKVGNLTLKLKNMGENLSKVLSP